MLRTELAARSVFSEAPADLAFDYPRACWEV